MASRTPSKRIRNAYYISTISVALVLFLLGTIAYMAINIQRTADAMVGDVRISLLLKDGLSKQQLADLTSSVKECNGVFSVEYVSADMAAKEFKKFSGTDFNLFIDENPLPASLEVSIAANGPEPLAVSALVDRLKSKEGVGEVLYQQGVVEQLTTNVFKLKIVLGGFLLALLMVSYLLINNTIRIAVSAKKFLIKTMKLVGATDGFIRKPFIQDAIMQGVVSSLLAWVFLGGLIFGMDKVASGFGFLPDSFWIIAILFLSMLVLGVIICLLCTNYAVNKYLNLDNNNLYVY